MRNELPITGPGELGMTDFCKHGITPPYACPTCSGMETYAPSLYREKRICPFCGPEDVAAWDEDGKADPMGMAQFFWRKFVESEKANNRLRSEILRVREMQKDKGEIS